VIIRADRTTQEVKLAETIREMASPTSSSSFNGYRAWTGVWTQSLIDELDKKCNFPTDLSDNIVTKLRRTARHVGMILADGARKLWRRRCELISLQKKGMKELLLVTERNHRAAYILQRITARQKKAAEKKAIAANTPPITEYFRPVRESKTNRKSLHATKSVLPGRAHLNKRKLKRRSKPRTAETDEQQNPELSNHTFYEHNDATPIHAISYIHTLLANDTSSLVRGSID